MAEALRLAYQAVDPIARGSRARQRRSFPAGREPFPNLGVSQACLGVVYGADDETTLTADHFNTCFQGLSQPKKR